MLTFGYDVEASGPNPFKDGIISIQFRRNSQNYIFKIWEQDNSERKLILTFLEEWSLLCHQATGEEDLFITYNLRLDAPYLLTRCQLNNIHLEKRWGEQLWNYLLRGPRFLDLYEVIGDRGVSLEQLKKNYGLSVSKFKNSEIPRLFQLQRYSNIEAYVKEELISLEKIYQLLVNEQFYKELEQFRGRLEGRH